jgi:hypothetical protein
VPQARGFAAVMELLEEDEPRTGPALPPIEEAYNDWLCTLLSSVLRMPEEDLPADRILLLWAIDSVRRETIAGRPVTVH